MKADIIQYIGLVGPFLHESQCFDVSLVLKSFAVIKAALLGAFFVLLLVQLPSRPA